MLVVGQSSFREFSFGNVENAPDENVRNENVPNELVRKGSALAGERTIKLNKVQVLNMARVYGRLSSNGFMEFPQIESLTEAIC